MTCWKFPMFKRKYTSSFMVDFALSCSFSGGYGNLRDFSYCNVCILRVGLVLKNHPIIDLDPQPPWFLVSLKETNSTCLATALAYPKVPPGMYVLNSELPRSIPIRISDTNWNPQALQVWIRRGISWIQHVVFSLRCWKTHVFAGVVRVKKKWSSTQNVTFWDCCLSTSFCATNNNPRYYQPRMIGNNSNISIFTTHILIWIYLWYILLL